MQQTGTDGSNRALTSQRIVTVIWFAILMSVGLFFLMTRFIQRPEQSEGGQVMVMVLTFLGSVVALLSFVPKRKLLNQSVAEQKLEPVQSAYIVSFAMSEAAALFGLLLFFATADRFYYLMFIVAVLFLLIHFPRRKDFLAAVFKSN